MKLVILILEDEMKVRNIIEQDLMGSSSALRVETAEDVTDVWKIVNEIDADGDVLALAVCDHRMPGTTGIEFMGQVVEDERTALTRKISLIGQASLTGIIRTVTDARLDQYVARPWKASKLQGVVRSLLTDYIELTEIEPTPYLGILGPQRAMQVVRCHSVAGQYPASNLPAVG